MLDVQYHFSPCYLRTKEATANWVFNLCLRPFWCRQLCGSVWVRWKKCIDGSVVKNILYLNIEVICASCWYIQGLIQYVMQSYQYRNSHCGEKMILLPFCPLNGISYTGNNSTSKIPKKAVQLNHSFTPYTSNPTPLYWIRAQVLL